MSKATTLRYIIILEHKSHKITHVFINNIRKMSIQFTTALCVLSQTAQAQPQQFVTFPVFSRSYQFRRQYYKLPYTGWLSRPRPQTIVYKKYVIEVMTWKCIYTYRERYKTGLAHNGYWKWFPFTSKHTWMHFSNSVGPLARKSSCIFRRSITIHVWIVLASIALNKYECVILL
jgi:hypothetical protein